MNLTEIIIRCKRSDPQGQRYLFDMFSDVLFRVASRYLRDPAAAEDAVMQAFMKVFTNIGSFESREGATVESWMRKITVNEALMSLRKHNNFNLMESIDDHHQITDDRWIIPLDGESIMQLIVELPAGYRTVFNLFVVEGYSHDEIAGLLGISPNTSRSQLFKAKGLLKKKIENENKKYGT